MTEFDYKGRKVDPKAVERTELRIWAESLSDTELAAQTANWEQTQCEAGSGAGRKTATRRLGYLRREAKRRWYS